MKLSKEFRERETKALQAFQELGKTALKQVFRLGYCSGYLDATELAEIKRKLRKRG